MASSYSTDLSLELVATGEKAGLWGTINNTNLQVLEAATAFIEVAITGTTQTLSLADGSATADGKHFYLKLTGSLSGDTTLTMPASTTGGTTTRVYIIEDATNRGTLPTHHNLSVTTTGGATTVPVADGNIMLLVSNGNTPLTTLGGILNQGYIEIDSATTTSFAAVSGNQIGVDTQNNIVTITLPTGVIGNEIIIMDASAANGFGTNKCTVTPSGTDKIQGTAASVDLTTNNQSVTLFYTGTDKGWQFKTNTA